MAAVLMAGCSTEHGETTDCAIDPVVCEQVCLVVASEGPSFEYGEPVEGECDAVTLSGEAGHCFSVRDFEGNIGCCRVVGFTSAWLTCEGQ